MNADPDVMRHLGDPLSLAELEAMSERLDEHWDTYGFGLWAVQSRDLECLGFVGACHPLWFPEFSEQVELGWRLSSQVWGRGIATEGARIAAHEAFTKLVLTEVIAFIAPENARSQAVAGRVGMQRTGSTADPRCGEMLDLLGLTSTVKGSAT